MLYINICLLTLLTTISGEQPNLCIISGQRSTLTINQSVEVNLTCYITSNSPHEFKWSKDDSALPPGNTYRVKGKLLSVLTIKNTSRSDSGKYKCVCANNNEPNNSDETEIAVHVRVPPRITARKSTLSLSVHRDESPFLNCNVDGFPEPKIKWFKDNENIKCKWGTVYNCFESTPPNSTLRLIAVKLHDAGIYRCEATNTYGTANMEFNVRVRAGTSRFHDENLTIRQNKEQNATLRCDFRNVFMDETEFSWVFGNLTITNSTRRRKYLVEVMKIGKTHLRTLLHIFNITDDDYGRYQCSVSTIDNEHASGFVRLQPELPMIEKRTALETSNMELIKKSLLIAVGCLTSALALLMVWYRIHGRKKWVTKYQDYTCMKEYLYDVFITYSGKDNEWIVNELLPCFEDNKVRYCIHNRDFELGKSIMENMADSVYRSRKVLAVISKNYVMSKYCRDELDIALYRSAEQGDSSVIVLKIDDIQHRKIPRSLRNKTYIDFSDPREKNTWKKRLLKEVKFPQEKSV